MRRLASLAQGAAGSVQGTRPPVSHPERGWILWGLLVVLMVGCSAPASTPADAEPQPATAWFKGNLHTHSLWSDGDDYPEMIVQWYKDHGYDFIALSDHNTIGEGEKWVVVPDSGRAFNAFERYVQQFGEDWVETRNVDSRREVRLRTYGEFRELLEEEHAFLVIRAEEITDGYDGLPVHVNATNIAEYIEPQGGASVLDVMQRNVDAVLEQRIRTGREMFPHINHPNFVYAVTAEDLIALEGEEFFEVYNGHPLVNNHGDHSHPGTERMWDIVLAHRLAEGRGIMFGLATDDAHNYHELQSNRANPGRGWVVVRAPTLETGEIVAALERGDFYASTGVSLRDVSFSGNEMHVSVDPVEGDTYHIQFMGTRDGFDRASSERLDDEGRPVTRAYSDEIGVVLAEVNGPEASYRLDGGELYVRARIVSSRVKANGHTPDEHEMAWTQPVLPAILIPEQAP